ncbi:hypothetical protein BC827DRAFT_930283 [Russula dissimulans]|nr:hypothetical protein BC827DRAFT_930283 [Russula dissimulans]
MSTVSTPTSFTPRPNFDSIFTSAFRAYKKDTGKDITSHPLAAELETCHSPDEILTVLRAKIYVLDRGDERFDKWLIPTINALYPLSSVLGEGIGLAFSPAKAIFVGVGVLFLAARDVSASREALIELFNRIEFFFRRLEIYTEVPPTMAMTEILVQIMVEVLMIVGIATKEVESGRFKKYLKKLAGNTEIEDRLRKLDKLIQEETRIAAAEQMSVTHSVRQGVKDVRNEVEDVGKRVQGVDNKVEDVEKMVQDVDERVQGVGERVQDKVQDVNHKLDEANRSSPPHCSPFRCLKYPHRNPAQR